jgi:hypothetical protein
VVKRFQIFSMPQGIQFAVLPAPMQLFRWIVSNLDGVSTFEIHKLGVTRSGLEWISLDRVGINRIFVQLRRSQITLDSTWHSWLGCY